LRTWKAVLPGEYRFGRGFHGALAEYPSLSKLSGCPLFVPLVDPVEVAAVAGYGFDSGADPLLAAQGF
jgi:hypothetical protein